MGQTVEEGAEGELGSCWDDSVSEEPQLVGAIVTGDGQLGIVHPTGRPISVSTQRGFSLPLLRCISSGSIDLAPAPPSSPCAPPLPVLLAGVGHW